MFIFLLFVLIAVIITLLIKSQDVYKELLALQEKYAPIVDVQTEHDKILKEIDNLKRDYKKKKEIFDDLAQKVKLYSEDTDIYDCGIYENQYDFETSTKYKMKLERIKEEEKALIRNDEAVTCAYTTREAKSQKKLVLKAFNCECNNLIQGVTWNNVIKTEERINKLFSDINKLAKSLEIEVSEEFLDLKIEELHLAHEFEQKKYEEKEEQKRLNEMMREQEKVLKEVERRQKEVERQEKEEAELNKKLQEAYAKGQQEIAEKYKAQIEELQKKIEESKRAISQAQMTKCGYVYVISNIGSFGENVYKIGMTRRLEPQDRIDELGDASVPFRFDVHALIKSDNAPELENKLHELFKLKSVNRVNYRKEFFNVSLEEIEKAVKQYTNAEIEFTKIAEAREYRETLAICKSESKTLDKKQEKTKEEFPLEI